VRRRARPWRARSLLRLTTMLAALPVHLATQFTSRNDLKQAVDAWDADQEYFLHGTGTHHGAEETHGHISGWDTSRVDDMLQLFSDKINFNGEIGGWDTSKVTNMEGTFNRALAFNKPLDWDTSKVTALTQTFLDALAFDQQLSWDTSSVTKMWQTFEPKHNVASHHNVFNQPLVWDTSKVTEMHYTFNGAGAFNSELNWDTSSVTTFNGFSMCDKLPCGCTQASPPPGESLFVC
jgi:surface protein